MAQEGILLESGTNEMELLVFRLGEELFGVNVAKVREIVNRLKTMSMPHSPEIVEGCFRLREEVLTLVNIGRHFGMQGEETARGDGLIIILELNNLRCGALVDAVESIQRLRWDEIAPPPQYLADLQAPITGVARLDDGRLVLLADFESILSDALGIRRQAEAPPIKITKFDPKSLRVLVVDDSPSIRAIMGKILAEGGFENVTIRGDGKEAWETIEERAKSDPAPFDIIITDIEMPQMDGLHLTNRIKQSERFKDIPVVLFSSLISADNKRKGQAVGADEQITKFNAEELLAAVERCLKREAAGLEA